MTRVAVALSGGVDSATAAFLLLQAGYEVFGVTMLVTGEEGEKAAEVAAKLKIPHFVFDLRQEFAQEVIKPFVEAYLAGLTPNPCVWCNRKLKFGLLLEKALKLGADFLATGHYARVWFDPARERYLLARGKDRRKDQSYFLYSLNQQQLARVLFPLGGRTKAENLLLVKKLGLPLREESQDVCFLKGGDYRELIKAMAQEKVKPGPILDPQGKKIGTHRGLAFYTIGQRRGLGHAWGKPYYVLALDPRRNALIVGPEEMLYRPSCRVEGINFILFERPPGPFTAAVQVRYTSPAVPATLFPEGEAVRVEFASPQRAVTPGQAAVFYQEDLVVGGGTIAPYGSDG
ncbi:tRNA (5-methylaminomethyl-2-thiouridylate)-methyltransferase [Ammonifex degensii KC4]|uniref:tRNA-specific 2-thiouridylase MnmA n=1 Tax=Ammonifex degensii (strain DSM 10501 / KC4) TaxID=429009 RepID=C9RAV2_AMMDK|nr:tRNA (5-methylaminomethyl-2-thiouridylate)-methyltransferase [Ammonifex degensii KC4]